MSGLFDSPLRSPRSPLYENMCRLSEIDSRCNAARAHCEDLWNDFRNLADQNFEKEFESCTHARWFEMYLTVSLIRAGHKITCPKPGPDVLLEADGMRIWIEATSPTPGESGRPNSVPRQEWGRIQREPAREYILRVLNALDEKQKKYRDYIDSGIVRSSDLNVVAINIFQVDGIGPYIEDHILRSLYGHIDPVVQIGRHGETVFDIGNATVGAVRKASGADVRTGRFVDNSLEHVSAVLASHADPFNRPKRLGDDFVLFPNFTGSDSWSRGVMKMGGEWFFDRIENGLKRTFSLAS